VLGIQGCAKWFEAPPAYQKGDAPEHRAWQAVGEILFRVWRGSDIDANSKLIEKAWARFDGAMVLAAADVLYQLNHSHWQIEKGDTAIDLVAMFPKQLRPILERCIEDREALPTVFRFGGSRDRGVIRFLIGSLGRLGDATTVPILGTIVDDPEFGKDAIQAIESIEKSILAQRALRAPQ
jgi:hypothetical protein